MKKDGQFILMNREEFKKYIGDLKVDNKFSMIQQHHTASPSYTNVKNNHIALMKSMKSYHLSRGFQDIAQHFSTFPDGLICLGRSFSLFGGGFLGNRNKGAITLEHVGYFDVGKDVMTDEQKKTIIFMNAILCEKFNIIPSITTLPYHTWEVTANKSCPGTNYFGGNSKQDAEKYFIPLIKNEINTLKKVDEVIDMLYKDDSEISKWANKAVYDMQDKGIMGGSNGRFNPKGEVTRQELACIIYNVMKYLGK